VTTGTKSNNFFRGVGIEKYPLSLDALVAAD
jgi:hypothetical protein